MNETYLVVLIMLIGISIIAITGFAIILGLLLRNANTRITWIENEFYRRQNEERVMKMNQKKEF